MDDVAQVTTGRPAGDRHAEPVTEGSARGACHRGIDPRDDSPDHQGTHEAATEPRHITAKATNRERSHRMLSRFSTSETAFGDS